MPHSPIISGWPATHSALVDLTTPRRSTVTICRTRRQGIRAAEPRSHEDRPASSCSSAEPIPDVLQIANPERFHALLFFSESNSRAGSHIQLLGPDMERPVNHYSRELGFVFACCVRGKQSCVFDRAARVIVEEQIRRLITLISAGRNRTVMIRRELPLTNRANLIRRSSQGPNEGSPSVSPSPITGAGLCKHQ